MKQIFKLAIVAGLIATTVGCQRIETGEVGVRVGFDKQVNQVSYNRAHSIKLLLEMCLHFLSVMYQSRLMT